MRITIPFEFMGEEFEIDLMVEYLIIDEVIEVETVETLDVRRYIGKAEQEMCASLRHLICSFASSFLNNTIVNDRTNEEIAKIIAEEL